MPTAFIPVISQLCVHSAMVKNKELQQQLSELEYAFAIVEKQRSEIIKSVAPSQVDSARNLLRYIAFRSQDLRQLQDNLHMAGLSSLSSSESHILAQIQKVQKHLGKSYKPGQLDHSNYEFGKDKLTRNSIRLLGSGRKKPPFVMVTLDNTFAEGVDYMEALLRAGMSVARINCARDNEATWLQMLSSLKQACRRSRKSCRVYMDLGGPRMRTEILGKGRKKQKVKLKAGDIFYLAEKDAAFNAEKVVLGCGHPGIVSMLKVNEPVLFDDGSVEGRILDITEGIARLKVVRNSRNGKKLGAEKGINFPDSDLAIAPLTAYDEECLPFICAHADMVGYSFVRKPADVALLQERLRAYPRKPAIIIKIESPESVRQMPLLFLQGMQDEIFGTMIARGDLAVEVGFERLSEIQNEVLWFAEAGHIPVIWATQVLESMHKTGIATRSEITDAAQASMAECVMINKGEYTLEVIETLIDVMKRTSGHYYKKRYRSRQLQIAQNIMQQKDWGVLGNGQ